MCIFQYTEPKFSPTACHNYDEVFRWCNWDARFLMLVHTEPSGQAFKSNLVLAHNVLTGQACTSQDEALYQVANASLTALGIDLRCVHQQRGTNLHEAHAQAPPCVLTSLPRQLCLLFRLYWSITVTQAEIAQYHWCPLEAEHLPPLRCLHTTDTAAQPQNP